MNAFNKAITKVVVSELNSRKSKKSTGVKIATINKDIPLIVIKPFSK